ncbi:hypothetical protein, partial [Nocardiopsis synnemataformans]|uniref:hypothetical protein n=1 Tax=Nocardiopsis synnemataformans TaxID=61305 RepID=UPI003EBE39E5
MTRTKGTPRYCAFCATQLGRGSDGEHILQQRHLDRWRSQPDGSSFTLEHHGGQHEPGAYTSDKPFKVMIDVCGPCNGLLNHHLDNPATKPSDALMHHLAPVHGLDVEHVVRWAIKIILLWHHPQSYYPFLRRRYQGRTAENRWTVPPADLVAMRDGT